MSDALDKTWQAIDEDMHREEARSTLRLGRSGLARHWCLCSGLALLPTNNVTCSSLSLRPEEVHNDGVATYFVVGIAVNVDDAVCRAEAPTLRMDSGRLSITIPIREGVPPDVVRSEVLKQMKGLSQSGGGRLFVQVSPGVPSAHWDVFDTCHLSAQPL